MFESTFSVRQGWLFLCVNSRWLPLKDKKKKKQSRKWYLFRLVNIHESCAHDASTTLLQFSQLTRSIVIFDVSKAASEQRASPLDLWATQSLCVYELIQGCFRHWEAVALFSGSSSNIVRRNELNWMASSWGHSYLSIRISYKLQGFSFEMCRSCPRQGENDIANTDVNYLITASDKCTF